MVCEAAEPALGGFSGGARETKNSACRAETQACARAFLAVISAQNLRETDESQPLVAKGCLKRAKANERVVCRVRVDAGGVSFPVGCFLRCDARSLALVNGGCECIVKRRSGRNARFLLLSSKAPSVGRPTTRFAVRRRCLNESRRRRSAQQ